MYMYIRISQMYMYRQTLHEYPVTAMTIRNCKNCLTVQIKCCKILAAIK